MRDIFIIRNYKTKEGEEKSQWYKTGVAFNPNDDGSVNFSLAFMPNVKFQIRDRKPREQRPQQEFEADMPTSQDYS
jgi:hypothetical protein